MRRTATGRTAIGAAGRLDARDLAGRMLVATPGLDDPNFERSVVLLWRQDGEGTVGFVVNRPHDHMTIADALDQVGLPARGWARRSMMEGGPCETDRALLLYGEDDMTPDDDCARVAPGIVVSGASGVLGRLSRARRAPRAQLMLGYAGWAPGQLEAEIVQGAWLVAGLDEDLVFGEDHATKWPRAMGSIGVDPAFLSAVSGTA